MTNLRVNRSRSRQIRDDYLFEEVDYNLEPIREYEDGVISKLVSNAVIHALEALLTALLLPIRMWQWLSKHDRFVIILRVIFEVVLELAMLIVFAGVSIMTAAALIFDDVYHEDPSNSTKSIPDLHAATVNENEGKPQGKSITTTSRRNLLTLAYK